MRSPSHPFLSNRRARLPANLPRLLHISLGQQPNEQRPFPAQLYRRQHPTRVVRPHYKLRYPSVAVCTRPSRENGDGYGNGFWSRGAGAGIIFLIAGSGRMVGNYDENYECKWEWSVGGIGFPAICGRLI